jgi:hypothetical protein
MAMDAISVPAPYNEPVRSYASGFATTEVAAEADRRAGIREAGLTSTIAG